MTHSGSPELVTTHTPSRKSGIIGQVASSSPGMEKGNTMPVIRVPESTAHISSAAQDMGVESGFLYLTLTEKGKEFVHHNLYVGSYAGIKELCRALLEENYTDWGEETGLLPVEASKLNYWHIRDIFLAFQSGYIHLYLLHFSDELTLAHFNPWLDEESGKSIISMPAHTLEKHHTEYSSTLEGLHLVTQLERFYQDQPGILFVLTDKGVSFGMESKTPGTLMPIHDFCRAAVNGCSKYINVGEDRDRNPGYWYELENVDYPTGLLLITMIQEGYLMPSCRNYGEVV